MKTIAKAITLLITIGSFSIVYGQDIEKFGKRTGVGDAHDRISMNVTIGKNKIAVNIVDGGCLIVFPNKQSFFIDTAEMRVKGGNAEIIAKVKAASPQTSASIVSTAVSGVASAASAAKSGRGKMIKISLQPDEDELVLPEDLPDGEYELEFKVVEKATSGLKNTLKTQVKVVFTTEKGKIKPILDTMINLIR